MIKSPVFLAVVLLLLTLVAVGYQALELNKVRLGKSLSVIEPQQVQKKQSVAADKLPTFAQLATRNIMGDPKKSPKQAVVQNAVPITALKLTLMGTIIKTEGGMSSALIQGNNRETKRYYVGETVEGGFTLHSVAVDSVVLKRDEQLETLKYPLNVSTSPVPPADRPQQSATNRPQQAAPVAGQPANQAKSLRERMRNARANKNAQPNSADK
jgi:hypothetical protein